MVISEDELKSRLDRVNSWISNCDQKASILLAVEGVMLTILCTPDYISWIRQKLIFPIYNYYETGYGEFSITNTILLILIAVMLALIVLSIFYSLQAIKGKTNPTLFKQPGLTEKSLLHFTSISNRNFNEFKRDVINQSEESILNDLYSQIYISSSICKDKFKNHKKSVCYFCTFLFLLVIVLSIQLIAK